MGREAEVVKDRLCRTCGQSRYGDAKSLIAHAYVCRLAARIGLILPGEIEQPRVRIYTPTMGGY